MTAAGIYRAKVVAPFSNGSCSVVIPQLFGDVQVTVTRFMGSDLPLTPSMGWVMFEGGDEDRPVWMDTDTPVTGDGWFVTQAEADAQAAITAAGLAARQPLDPDLTAISALISAADKMPYTTGTGTWALTDLTAFARLLLAAVDVTTLQALTVPAATVWATAASTADPGWMLCNGATVTNAQTLYPSFWSRAPVSGRSGADYVLPDIRGRVIMGAGTGASPVALTARTLGTAYSNEETHALTAAESGVPVHSHANTFSFSADVVSTDHYHGIGGSTGNDAPDHTHAADPNTIANYDVAGRQAAATAGWWHGIGAWNSYGASTRHTHPLPANTSWLSSAGSSLNYTHGHTTTKSGGVTDNASAAAASAHNNIQPSYALNYQIKVH